jgi:hypothetical protein
MRNTIITLALLASTPAMAEHWMIDETVSCRVSQHPQDDWQPRKFNNRAACRIALAHMKAQLKRQGLKPGDEGYAE